MTVTVATVDELRATLGLPPLGDARTVMVDTEWFARPTSAHVAVSRVDCVLCNTPPALDLSSGRRFCRKHGPATVTESLAYAAAASNALPARSLRLYYWRHTGRRTGGAS